MFKTFSFVLRHFLSFFMILIMFIFLSQKPLQATWLQNIRKYKLHSEVLNEQIQHTCTLDSFLAQTWHNENLGIQRTRTDLRKKDGALKFPHKQETTISPLIQEACTVAHLKKFSAVAATEFLNIFSKLENIQADVVSISDHKAIVQENGALLS